MGFGGCPRNGTYQNGAHWATPLPYVVQALLSTGNGAFATQLMEEAMEEFKTRGIFEDVGFETQTNTTPISLGILNYTASATNALLAARLLSQVHATKAAGSLAATANFPSSAAKVIQTGEKTENDKVKAVHGDSFSNLPI